MYNGQPPYGYRGYVGDLVQRMMGYATLRQVRLVSKCKFTPFLTSPYFRIKRNTCRVAPQVQNLTRECSQKSRIFDEDKSDYCNAWEEKTELTK